MLILQAICVGAVILGCCWIKVTKAVPGAPFSLPKGPQPFPFFGNLWTIYTLNSSPRELCRRFKAQYGDMTTVWMGSWPTVFLNSPQVAHELLHKVLLYTKVESSNLMLTIQAGAPYTASRPMHNRVRHEKLPCERFAVNVVFQVMYGRRLGREEDHEIAALYEIWKKMYLCMHALIINVPFINSDLY
jgi:hypothetical protein